MKKIIAVASMAAVMASIATAEITTSMWGRSYIEMLNYNTDTGYGYAVMGPAWAPAGRVGLTVSGTNDEENCGFVFQIDYNGATSVLNTPFTLDDNAKMWAQLGPARLTLGKMREDDMRGSGAFDDFYFGYGLGLRDDMFNQFGQTAGIHLDFAYEGLYAAVGFDAYNTSTTQKFGKYYLNSETGSYDFYRDEEYNQLTAAQKAKLTAKTSTGLSSLAIENFYKTVKAVVGYHIDGVGTVKAQLQANGFANQAEFINVGFNSSELMDGLEFEIGSTIYLEKLINGNEDKTTKSLIIPVGVKYTGIDNVAIRFQAEYSKEGKINVDNSLRFGLDGMYTMGDMDLGLATTYEIGLASTTQVHLNFVPFMGYHVGPGFVFAGADVNVYMNDKTYATFGIPVGLQMGF